MSGPFDSDLAGEVDIGDAGDEIGALEESGDAGSDNMFDNSQFEDDFDTSPLIAQSGNAATDLGGEVDDMALWSAFEEELGDGLDAMDDDEFVGRLLGGLGRAAGVLSRGLGGAAAMAGQVGGIARQAGQVAGRIGSAAGAVSPAAMAAARMARMLGAPGVANALGQAGQIAQDVGRAAGHAQGLAGSLGQAAGGAQGVFGQISQLLRQSSSADEAFDALADLYLEDGVDAALPAVIGLAARAAARGLGLHNISRLSQGARRALVRGVAAAARELTRSRGPQAVRALPRLAQSAAQVAQHQATTPQRAARLVRRGLPQAARRLAQNPSMIRRLAQPGGPRPLARPTDLGRGICTASIGRGRTFHIAGPATLTIMSR
ncbi:hypothetical protein F0160_25835 [Paraburkholderia sp. JPY303]|uniref:hypothetical protein n=1 Tax=Paraburkholderia atlantica TaxID=2654982 RepID=UPI001590EF2C|nr:hypothetical protein [Paraburkholderia atlantica]NUY33899.1 hypothetical protein [Paraburkholderia atlantica]